MFLLIKLETNILCIHDKRFDNTILENLKDNRTLINFNWKQNI